MSVDIAIDLGTSVTRMYVEKRGIVVSEPTAIAVDLRDDNILAVGQKAYDMLGRTSDSFSVLCPLEGGVVSDFNLVVEILERFLKKVGSGKFVMPRAIACVPSEITEVEKRAIVNTISTIGIRKVFLIEEQIAAAIGAGVDVEKPCGTMIMNIGGGTSSLAIVTLGGISDSRCIKIAGNSFDEDIIKYVKSKYKLTIGKRMSERVKIELGTLIPLNEEKYFKLKGRDNLSGMPRAVNISSSEICDAIKETALKIIREAQELLEEADPELAGDIFTNGIILTGGSARINGFDKIISDCLKLKVIVPKNPENCVVLGAGMATKYLDGSKNEPIDMMSSLSAEF